MKLLIIPLFLFVLNNPAFANDASLKTEYENSCSVEDSVQKAALEKSNIIDLVRRHINEDFELPETISIKLTCANEDGDYGPYYDPQTREIVMPYSFRRYVLDELKLQEYAEKNDELQTVADDIVLHTIYHELGHAFVDILNIPITGKEEDAVDELSTFLLLSDYDDGDEVSISAADFFDIESLQEDEITEDRLFGEHSLDEQRFFNILCFVYGENPAQRSNLLDGLDIEEGRAEMCVEDFERRSQAWQQLLAPYTK